MLINFNKLIILCTFTIIYELNGASEFIIGIYLPYWKHQQGIKSALNNIKYMNQISPFSYEVNQDGNLIDKFKRNNRSWTELFKICHEKNIKIVPTIFWTNTSAISRCFGNRKKRYNHIDQIINKILQKKFDGININYERINSQDREYFLDFIKNLSYNLHKHNLMLCISMGGRTSDASTSFWNEFEKGQRYKIHSVSLNPGSGYNGKRFKHTLATCCDQIHLMGYDEWGIPARFNIEHLNNRYYVSHASDQWIEKIIQYTLTYIPADKLILGIPTYGIEFIIYLKKNDISIKKVRNVTTSLARKLADEYKQEPKRTAGAELSFTYTKNNELHYVCFLDIQAIENKIKIAKKYNLKGIYFFKIDGLEDKAIWPLLEKTIFQKSRIFAQRAI